MLLFKKETGILAAFVYAFNGLFWALKSQINLRIHLLATVLVGLAGWLLKFDYYEWLIIISVIFTTLVLELLNTSIEQATDAITQEFNPYIKRAKDVSAAAVLMFAMYAVIIALAIFLKRII